MDPIGLDDTNLDRAVAYFAENRERLGRVPASMRSVWQVSSSIDVLMARQIARPTWKCTGASSPVPMITSGGARPVR